MNRLNTSKREPLVTVDGNEDMNWPECLRLQRLRMLESMVVRVLSSSFCLIGEIHFYIG